MVRVQNFILSEPCFWRMMDFHGDTYPDYAAFMKWNTTCLQEMSIEELNWLTGLCTRLQNNNISLMDMENCIRFTADCFYFDTNKRLIICNPR